MTPLVANIDFGLIFGLGIPVGAILVVSMTAILTSHHRKLQRDDMEATLKMEMIQRGMSAEEIERVLAAQLGRRSRHSYNWNCNSKAASRDASWRQYEQPHPAQR